MKRQQEKYPDTKPPEPTIPQAYFYWGEGTLIVVRPFHLMSKVKEEVK